MLGRDSFSPSLLPSCYSQGNKIPAGPAPDADAAGDSGASDEWVFDRKVSEANTGWPSLPSVIFCPHGVHPQARSL